MTNHTNTKEKKPMKKKTKIIAAASAALALGLTIVIAPSLSNVAPTEKAEAVMGTPYAYAPGYGPYNNAYPISYKQTDRRIKCASIGYSGKFLFAEYAVKSYTTAPWLGQKYEVERIVRCQ